MAMTTCKSKAGLLQRLNTPAIIELTFVG